MGLSKKTTKRKKAPAVKSVRKKTPLKKISESQQTINFFADDAWKNFFKNSSNIVSIVDRKNRILDINRVMKGFQRASVIGSDTLSFIEVSFRKQVKAAIAAVFKDGKVRKMKMIGLAAEGKLAYYHVTMSPYKKDKKITGVILDAIDLTEQEISQQNLSRSEEKYRKLSDAAFEGIVIHQRGLVVEVNKATTEIFGFSEKQLLGRPIFDFIHPDFHQFALKRLNTKDENVYEMQMLRKGNKVFWVELVAREIVYNDDRARVVAIRDISEKKEFEKALRLSEERFRMLAENAVDIIARYQVFPEHRLEYISPSVETITGYTPQEHYDDPFLGFKIIHPDDRPSITEMEQLTGDNFRGVKIKPLVARWIRKDGRTIWIETINRPVFNDSGKLIAIESVGRDVTERKKLEQELAQGETALTQILDTINELVYYVEFLDDGKKRINYLGANIEKMLGITREQYEQMGSALLDHVHPDDRDELLKRSSDLKKKLLPQQFTYRFLNKNTGKYIWLEDRITPRLDERGKHIGNFGITSDVTERIEAESLIKENEEKFRMLAENALDVIYRYSVVPEPRYEYVSPSIIRMSGYTPEEFYKDPYLAFKIIHPDDIHLIGDAEASLRKKREINQVTQPAVVQRWIKKSGELIWTETRTQNVYDKQGRKIAVEGISRDITAQKQSEEQLHESKERFRLLANVAFEGVVFSDNSIVIDANDQFLSMFGYKNLEEVVGKHLIEDFVWSKEQELAKKFARLSSSVPLEVRAQRKDGSLFPVEIKGQTIPFSHSTVRATVIYDITKRKEDETVLKQSVENYKSLVDHSPDGVMIHHNGKIIFANPSALRIMGAEKMEEVVGRGAFEFILPEYIDEVMERLNNTMNGISQSFFELRLRNFKGEIRSIETRPIRIKFNGVDAIQVVFHDVTTQKQLLKEQLRAQLAEEANLKLQLEISERLRTERELKEAQKYTRMLIDSSLDMICASDRQGRITEFNLAAQRTFGYTLDEILQQPVSILYARPEDRDRITDEDLYKNGSFTGEVINKKKNGELFTAYLSASVLKNDRGEVIGAMGVSRDISLLKQAEEELRASEERLIAQSSKLNAVIESSSHVIWTIDRSYCVTSFNKNFAEHMRIRYGVKAHVGLNMISGDTVTSNEYNKFWIEKYERVFKGYSDYFETKLIDKFGNLVWREIYLNPILNEKGEIVEISGIGHDITEKKLAEEKIRQSLQEKEILLKEVHHRVKNNLQVISSILNLQSSYVKDPGTLNILKESQNRIKSMAFIHESLYQTKDFTSINFSEYVVNLANNLIHSYSNVENEINLKLDIQNVFLNLDLAIPCGLIINEIVSNALKYAFVEASGDEAIEINMSLIDENLELEIADNGRGLPPEIDFRNTESLGLQLVVTLTDQLNGTIEMDNSNGTRYRIIFKQNQVKNRI